MANYANLTVSMAPGLLVAAREEAAKRGTTINTLVRDFFEKLTKSDQEQVKRREVVDKLLKYQKGLGGWKFKREEWYEESYRDAGRLQKWLS